MYKNVKFKYFPAFIFNISFITFENTNYTTTRLP